MNVDINRHLFVLLFLSFLVFGGLWINKVYLEMSQLYPELRDVFAQDGHVPGEEGGGGGGGGGGVGGDDGSCRCQDIYGNCLPTYNNDCNCNTDGNSCDSNENSDGKECTGGYSCNPGYDNCSLCGGTGTPTPNGNDADCSVFLPDVVPVGSEISITTTLFNSGTTTWTPSSNHHGGNRSCEVNSQFCFTDSPGNRRYLVENVAPNNSVTWNSTVTVPSSAGSYTFEWQAVQDGVEWFGAICNKTVTVEDGIPNCSSINGSATPVLRESSTYGASFYSPGNELEGWLGLFAGISSYGSVSYSPFMKSGNRAVNDSNRNQVFSGSYIPILTGSYPVSCRTWNDGIAECRYSPAVDGPPRFSCVGPGQVMYVTPKYPTPQASYTASPTTGVAPLTVDFGAQWDNVSEVEAIIPDEADSIIIDTGEWVGNTVIMNSANTKLTNGLTTVNGEYPWSGTGVTAAWINEGGLVLANKTKYWKMDIKTKLWDSQNDFANLNPSGVWANAPKVDGVGPWEGVGGISGGYHIDTMFYVISKDKYWSLDKNNLNWLGWGHWGNLGSPWSDVPRVNGKAPWDDEGITATWSRNGKVFFVSNKSYWVMDVSHGGWNWIASGADVGDLMPDGDSSWLTTSGVTAAVMDEEWELHLFSRDRYRSIKYETIRNDALSYTFEDPGIYDVDFRSIGLDGVTEILNSEVVGATIQIIVDPPDPPGDPILTVVDDGGVEIEDASFCADGISSSDRLVKFKVDVTGYISQYRWDFDGGGVDLLVERNGGALSVVGTPNTSVVTNTLVCTPAEPCFRYPAAVGDYAATVEVWNSAVVGDWPSDTAVVRGYRPSVTFTAPVGGQTLSDVDTISAWSSDFMNDMQLVPSTSDDELVFEYSSDGGLNYSEVTTPDVCSLSGASASNEFSCNLSDLYIPGQEYSLRLNIDNGDCISDANAVGSSTTFQFSIPPWYQIETGDVHANGFDMAIAYRSRIPSTCGVPFACNPSFVTGSGIVSSSVVDFDEPWGEFGRIGDEAKEVVGGSHGDFNFGYSYWYDKLVSDLTEVNHFSAIIGGGYYILDSTDSLVTDFNIPAGEVVVVFYDAKNLEADDELTISINQTVGSNGALFMIVNGDIRFADPVSNLQGVYLADNIDFGGGNQKLTAEGAFYGIDSVTLRRDLGNANAATANAGSPAELFVYRPDIIYALFQDENLQHFDYFMREVAPY